MELEAALAFLTTDRWRLRFHHGVLLLPPQRELVLPQEDCIVLISGGLDSLVGAIDLVAEGKRPLAVSQTVRGDAEKQLEFAAMIGGGLNQLQLNHNVCLPGADESSQRARSLIFMAYGVLAATTLQRYHDGGAVPLYVCENGFIAINPSLTGSRLGSLSTRTAHPEFLGRLGRILDAAELRVQIKNPYATKTKGEMLFNCADQALLKTTAVRTTSCGRFQRFNYRQCGRCVPCQVRRAAFIAWGGLDTTGYVYEDIGRDSEDYVRFDDIRSVAMAIAAVNAEGLDAWLGGALSYPMIENRPELQAMVQRGLYELRVLHEAYGVR
jgi:7-cyano-7-deazaguanine synthase in queuosine biosynthesis